PGSFGYRPKKTAHEAVGRVAQAIVQHKTRVIDLDLRSYFDNIRHDRLLAKVAKRVHDDDVMHLLKIMLKANGRCGVPQGGVVSPLKVLEQHVDTSTSAGRAFFSMFAVFAAFETDVRRERQAEGIAKAERAGRYQGGVKRIDRARVQAL